jgi:hypothetical protein
MTSARRLFLVAGIYGLAILLPQYFMEGWVGRDFPPAISHPEYFYGFLGVGSVWQLAFFIIAHDPVRYRLMMIPGALEKISFGTAAVVLYSLGRVTLTLLGFGIFDLVLAALFLRAYVQLGRYE